MRKKLFFLLAGIIILAACSHQKEKDEIARVAYGYLEAMGNYRINDAAEYSSKGTCETTIPVFNKMMEISDSAKLMENTPAEIEITGVSILSDTTARAYFNKHTPITEQTDSVLLILEDGRWLVDVRILPPSFLTPQELPRDSADNVIRERARPRALRSHIQ